VKDGFQERTSDAETIPGGRADHSAIGGGQRLFVLAAGIEREQKYIFRGQQLMGYWRDVIDHA